MTSGHESSHSIARLDHNHTLAGELRALGSDLVPIARAHMNLYGAATNQNPGPAGGNGLLRSQSRLAWRSVVMAALATFYALGLIGIGLNGDKDLTSLAVLLTCVSVCISCSLPFLRAWFFRGSQQSERRVSASS